MPAPKPSRRSVLALLGSAALSQVAATPSAVDLALVLAIDCSYSVDAFEYRLQMRGIGQAFLDSNMLDVISRGARKRIAIAAFHWSDTETQQVIVPWRVLEKAQDAIALADLFLAAPRVLLPGATATGSALLFAKKLLDYSPLAFRKVVDVSTDGQSNVGPSLPLARDALLAEDITINGLAIVNEEVNLVSYLQKNMIGGRDSFVLMANDFNAYSAAIRQKLFKEITNESVI